MIQKYFLYLFFITISPTLYSQSLVNSKDTLIDATNKTTIEVVNELLQEKSKSELYSTTLFIIDGKKMDVKDNKANFALLNTNVKNLEILTEKEQIRKYTTDSLFNRVVLVSTGKRTN